MSELVRPLPVPPCTLKTSLWTTVPGERIVRDPVTDETGVTSLSGRETRDYLRVRPL